MNKKVRNILLWTAGAVGILYLIRKGTGVADMLRNVKFDVMCGGAPTVDMACFKLPIAVKVSNTTSGSIKVRIDQAMVFINDEQGRPNLAANVSFDNYEAREMIIRPYCESFFWGINVDIPIYSIASLINENIYDIINFKVYNLLDKVSVKGRATIEDRLQINFEHSFAGRRVDDINGLGFTAETVRKLKPFSDYSALIPPRTELNRDDLIIRTNGSTEDTVEIMKQIVSETLSDTEALARNLKMTSTYDSVKSVWDFVYEHIQYVRDSPTTEQVRRPLRTLYDREGDCDCYAVLCASLFENMGIPWHFRITKYYNRSYWQHVYVIVPYDGGYLVCDPVMDKCFSEKEPTEFKDY